MPDNLEIAKDNSCDKCKYYAPLENECWHILGGNIWVYADKFIVGPKFGCIHWIKKD